MDYEDLIVERDFPLCTRCGEDHKDCDTYRFVKPVVTESAVFTRWAMCPITGDPILIQEKTDGTSEGV